jgi:hypothetical protein
MAKKEAGLKFYEYSQNNTGGSFVTDDKLCHRLFIEANSSTEADEIAEGFGCYWNGVDEGSDCPCCGDRWYSGYVVDISTMTKEKNSTYPVELWVDRKNSDTDPVADLKARYSNLEWDKEPELKEKYGSPIVEGVAKLRTIEDYAQIMADQYGWTSPDIRIFYNDGSVKEIFSLKVEEQKAKKKSKVNKIG